MSQLILHKRNGTVGSIPAGASLTQGELAVNTADGKVFTKKANGDVVNVADQSSVGTLYGLVAKVVDVVINKQYLVFNRMTIDATSILRVGGQVIVL